MPKTHVEGGPSYADHVDVSSPDTAAPEWAPAPEAEPEAVPEPVVAPEPVVEDKPRKVRRR